MKHEAEQKQLAGGYDYVQIALTEPFVNSLSARAAMNAVSSSSKNPEAAIRMIVILVCALGFNSVGGLTFAVGGVSINLSGLAIAAIVGILLNAILPGNDYEFDAANGSDAPSSANLQV